MAFINKELTEERKAIIDRKIEFGFGRIAHPRFATIDKESYFFLIVVHLAFLIHRMTLFFTLKQNKLIF